MNEKEIRDTELAEKVNKIIYYDFKDDKKNDIFIVLDALVNATELKDLSATQTLIKNQYYIIQNEHLEKIIQNQKAELQKKDKIIDEMAKVIKGVKSGSKYCNVFKTPPCKKDKTYPCDVCIKQYYERKANET